MNRIKVNGLGLIKVLVFLIGMAIQWVVFFIELLIYFPTLGRVDIRLSDWLSDGVLWICKKITDKQLRLTLVNNPYDPDYKG